MEMIRTVLPEDNTNDSMEGNKLERRKAQDKEAVSSCHKNLGEGQSLDWGMEGLGVKQEQTQ